MTTMTYQEYVTRRWFLKECGVGLGTIALHSLLQERAARGQGTTAAPADPLTPRRPHFAAKATNVIYLFMAGGPSHLELFDNKPALARYNGTLPPPELLEGYRAAFIRPNATSLGPKFRFARHGQSGVELSELLPHLARCADDIAVVKTLHTEQINHGPAQLMFHTGFGRFGRPSVGSWVSYGLGSENRDLPAYVAMITGRVAGAGSALWGSGFLPGVYQGVEFRSQGDPVLFLSDPPGIERSDRRRIL